ncbi:hypothetical protein G7Y89_g14065 [Cudoniella acicularis]|uniref:Rhodopsin domain-containing protein n=1 Tax=Cudoniella acicularis TaxID=354080 RepID=A0A8H4R839_9HELO|nr:hypothetical protein G7Y89_g14065 [Cudoniella acicularis]
MMESLKAVFFKPDPQAQVRKCNTLIRQNTRKLDRDISQLKIVEGKAKTSIIQANRRAQRNPSQANQAAKDTRIFAKELIRIRKQSSRLITSKAQLNSVAMQVSEAFAVRKIEGSIRSSVGIMKDVNSLVRLPELMGTMRELSQELVKAGIIEEMVGDSLPDQLEDDEEEAESEVDKVLGEILQDRMGKVGATPTTPTPVKEPEPEPVEEDEEDEAAMLDQMHSLPLTAPPEGVVSNFVNPDSNGYILVNVTSVFLIFQILFFIARIYTRAFVARRLRWDDLACTIGFILSVTLYVLSILCVNTGYFGYHMWDISVGQATHSNMFILGLLVQFIYPLSMAFLKLTLFIFLYTLFNTLPWARITIYFGAITSTLLYTTCIVLHAVLAVPQESQLMAQIPKYEKFNDMLSVIYAFSVFFDFYILVLPLVGIWGLQLSAKRKMGVSCVFLTGVMACVCSVLMLYYRIALLHSNDSLRTVSFVLTTSVLESQIGTAFLREIPFSTSPAPTPLGEARSSVILGEERRGVPLKAVGEEKNATNI